MPRLQPLALVVCALLAACTAAGEPGISASPSPSPARSREIDERVSIENLRFGARFLYDVLVHVGR